MDGGRSVRVAVRRATETSCRVRPPHRHHPRRARAQRLSEHLLERRAHAQTLHRNVSLPRALLHGPFAAGGYRVLPRHRRPQAARWRHSLRQLHGGEIRTAEASRAHGTSGIRNGARRAIPTTGDRRYLDFAGYLLSGVERERLHLTEDQLVYLFSGKPFTARTEFEGHAVRAMYASCGA